MSSEAGPLKSGPSTPLAGKTDEALGWLENTVRIGNVNYPFWSRHNQWVAGLRSDARFGALMGEVEQERMSILNNTDIH